MERTPRDGTHAAGRFHLSLPRELNVHWEKIASGDECENRRSSEVDKPTKACKGGEVHASQNRMFLLKLSRDRQIVI